MGAIQIGIYIFKDCYSIIEWIENIEADIESNEQCNALQHDVWCDKYSYSIHQRENWSGMTIFITRMHAYTHACTLQACSQDF